ncbi:hypothetical protein AAC387_Pa02g0209 [Persea americana]
MNNWLAFSLNSQELPPQSQSHAPQAFSSGLGFNSNEGVSSCEVSSDNFDLPSDSTVGQFGILDAYNRTHQPQDWSMEGGETHFKTGSDLSMIVGSSSNQNLNQGEPKLEDFLGGHSYANSCNYMYSNCSMQQLPTQTTMVEMQTNGCSDGINSSGSNTIGLSMIKTWLRSQPAPIQPESKNNAGGSGDVTGSIGASANAQTLSLSMSTGSQSSTPLPLLTASGGGGSLGGGESSLENKQEANSSNALDSQTGAIEAVPRKSIDTFGQRTSIYRGVTRHRWTGRYEAHLWDNSCRREGQTRKGRQGGYDKEEKAARAYDLAALKYWGSTTTTNFPISNYERELEEMKNMTRQEYVASLRRKSSGFSRGASMYRGVTRHHQHGRWQARIGRVAGNKDLYLGTFSTQEEAAEAYDIAAIKFRGLNAVTNFDMSRYDVKSIIESTTLPIGGAAKRLKEAEQLESSMNGRRMGNNIASQLTDGISSYGSNHPGWPAAAFQQGQPLSMQYPYDPQRGWLKQEPDNFAASHGLHGLQQLHLGNPHMLQPSIMPNPNVMSLEQLALEQSSGSNSVIYGGGGSGSNGDYQGAMGGSGGYIMPINTVIADQGHQQNNGSFGDQNMLASADSYAGRNIYYNNMGVGQGAPIFSVWNDT